VLIQQSFLGSNARAIAEAGVRGGAALGRARGSARTALPRQAARRTSTTWSEEVASLLRAPAFTVPHHCR
jgi:hypothetical protein